MWASNNIQHILGIRMENENPTKSIIYGNTFQNKYGKFLPICSSIIDRSSITNILDYLKQTPHFKKFNRIAYAYRVDQMPVVFITQKKNIETQYYEGCHSDETVEGSGEKLLHLLEKFNVRNVLIAVLIHQVHPLLPFQCVNYRAIVENSRMLLDQLYRKVIQFQDSSHGNQKTSNGLLLNQEKVVKMKKVDLAQQISIPAVKKNPPKQRPNYVYGPQSSTKPTLPQSKQKNPQELNQQQLSFLWQRCKTMKQNYKKLQQTLQPPELQQLKYFVMYDKNQLINIIIQMFLIYQGISREQLLEDYDWRVLRERELEMLPGERLRKMDQILKMNKKISVDVVLRINRGLGVLFSLMDISIRYSKNLERITKNIEKAEQAHNLLSKEINSNVVKIDAVL